MALGNPVTAGLLLLLLAVALALLGIAMRHRLACRIGLRNVYRARGRTVLLILGLLVATTIISGSLAVGNTISNVEVHYTVLAVGYNDEVISNQSPSGAFSPFPYSVYVDVASATAHDPAVAGVAPEIVGTVSVLDRTRGIPQTNLNLIGTNGNQSAQLGPFVAADGASLPGPAPDQVFLDSLAASEMNASAGDALLLFGAGSAPIPAIVGAVVADNLRGAFLTGGVGDFGDVFVPLATAQALEQMPGAINFLSVTNTGDLAERLAAAPRLSAQLNTTLAAIPAAAGLSAEPFVAQQIAAANAAGSSVSTLFLVLGLFSIAAGAMLIVGIFVLLAEERKGEMGVLRAIGLQSRELVYSFLFEGVAYSAASALAGTFLGVGVGYGLTYAFGELYRTPGLPPNALLDSFTVSGESLVTAYVAGFLLTLVTIAVASRRASRLNIVRAIRDLAEPPPPLRTYTYLAYVGAVATLLGLALYAATYRGSTDLSDPILGGALAIVGIALVAARFAPNRVAFSFAGVALLVWVGSEPLHAALLGPAHTGGIFIVFVEGILMVAGALLLYAFNSAPIARGLVRLAGGRSRRAPVAQIGLSYPSRRPARTTISLAIFALVIFTLVAIAGAGATIDASLAHTLAEQSGGYTFVAYSARSIPDLPGLAANNSTVAPLFPIIVPLVTGGVYVNGTGFAEGAYADSLFAAPANASPDSSFYATNHFGFVATEDGASAAEVFAELADQPDVAIVDQSYSAVSNNLGVGSGGSGHPHVVPGMPILLTNPATGKTATVTVIGILSESLVTGVFVSPPTALQMGYHAEEAFFLTLASGASATRAAQVAKAVFFPYGFVILDIENLLATSIASTEGVIGLLQIFVGLGLAVGVAAMGIVALRAVTERRREIGMIRANGFTRGMVGRAFFLEYTYVTLVGIGIGVALGLLIVWNLTQSSSASGLGITNFAIPWGQLALILTAAYALSMLAVAEPSLRASRLPPAEAVRPTE